MKSFTIPFLLVAVISGVVSCKKSGVDNSQIGTGPQTTASKQIGTLDEALFGTWQLVSDSSSSYSQSNGSHGSTYIGTPTDKFTFTENGTAYITEHAVTDTGSYGINSDNSLEIVYPTRTIAGVTLGNSADYFRLATVDKHHATFSNAGWSPGGVYFVRIVILTK
jgi:hypothetical protein